MTKATFRRALLIVVILGCGYGGAPDTAWAQISEDLIVDTNTTISDSTSVNSVVVSNGATLTIAAPLVVVGDMVIEAGCTVDHAQRQLSGLLLTVGGTLRIDGSINVTGRGLLAGIGYAQAGEGYNPDTGQIERLAGEVSGGSHGGLGGQGYSPLYDDEMNPILLGAGGGAGASSTSAGGNGGGTVLISAGVFILDGAIRADGLTGANLAGGGGAGGTVNLDVGLWQGTGLITANGANVSFDRWVGAGGGGRIAVRYDTREFTGTMEARGGADQPGGTTLTAGSAGTIYVQDKAQPHGDLIIDNGGVDGFNHPDVVLLGSLGPRTFRSIEVRNRGRLVVTPQMSPFAVTDTTRVEGVGRLTLLASSGFGSPAVLLDSGGVLVNQTDWTVGAGDLLRIDGGSDLVNDTGARLALPRLDTTNFVHGRIDNRGRLDLVDTRLSITAADTLWLQESGQVGADNTLSSIDIAGMLPVDHPLTVEGDMTVAATGWVTHQQRQLTGLQLDVSDTLRVMGRIDVTGRGLLAGVGDAQAGEGYNPDTGQIERLAGEVSGGSHGGLGGLHYSPLYDDEMNPTLLGAGGGAGASSTSAGGNGGGAVFITAGVLAIEGSIRADGLPEASLAGGGGAGGAVNLDVGLWQGTGRITANGGDVDYDRWVGAGGGGRIAVRYDTREFTGTMEARGGADQPGGTTLTAGSAGTIYVQDRVQPHGDLIVDNGGVDGFSHPDVVLLGSLGSRTFRNIEVRNRGRLVVTPQMSPFAVTDTTRIEGVGRLTLLASSGFGSPAVLLDNGGALVNQTDWTVGAGDLLRIDGGSDLVNDTGARLALPRLDATNLVHGRIDNLGRLDLVDSRMEVAAADTLWLQESGQVGDNNEVDSAVVAGFLPCDIQLTVNGDMTITAGGWVTHQQRQLTGLQLTVSDTLRVEGRIDVTGRGLLAGVGGAQAGESYNPDTGQIERLAGEVSGGSHGGLGGLHYSPLYDNEKLPSLLGAGGGAGASGTSAGGNGGGAVIVTAGVLVVDGSIRADGFPEASLAGGGGAGGTVHLWVDTWQGDGLITANGGDVDYDRWVGGGGGGRIAVHYTTNQFSGTVMARGGADLPGGSVASAGSAGTIYLEDVTQPQGDLIIDNNGEADFNNNGPGLLATLGPRTFRSVTIRNQGRLIVSRSLNPFRFEQMTLENGGEFHLPLTAANNGVGSIRFDTGVIRCDTTTTAAPPDRATFTAQLLSGAALADWTCNAILVWGLASSGTDEQFSTLQAASIAYDYLNCLWWTGP